MAGNTHRAPKIVIFLVFSVSLASERYGNRDYDLSERE